MVSSTADSKSSRHPPAFDLHTETTLMPRPNPILATRLSDDRSTGWCGYQLPSRARWERSATRVALIGAGPGPEESVSHRPFDPRGTAGRRVRAWIRGFELSENDVVLANVFLTRPRPSSNGDNFLLYFRRPRLEDYASVPGLAAWPPRHIRRVKGQDLEYLVRDDFRVDLERLSKTLLTYRPNAIVGFGEWPLWALTGRFRITSELGSRLCRAYACVVPGLEGIPVVIGRHPSRPQLCASAFAAFRYGVRRCRRTGTLNRTSQGGGEGPSMPPAFQ